ncbi:Cof-type HAD-IIB family hydrolase [Clostridium estertheticum]|uniref:Cof-type HAD-IIB family hydrolase n=1 Tax=Clostridium estertheticum TaxID=238834 RepID=UPI001CF35617|nr:Cof-type HAD-IIB family hydrolase [Clostridium estertheticum]MCB2353335.1 Cof-type HAD-IIB family hydrolase [Clostridium estertheticum]WAG41684.1 Cof-type HAD-IIB family hydrolase [Clostridium estertheticum]
MGYKLVCIDMDGTLLNSKHKVSNASKEALLKAHNKGVKIVISTGRMYSDAEFFSNLIGVKAPVIASNGAFIKQKNEKEAIYKNILEEKLFVKLLNVFIKYKVYPTFYTPQNAYCGSIIIKVFVEYIKLRGGMSRATKIKYIRTIKQWDKVFKIEKNNMVKCEVMHKDTEKLLKVRAEIQKIEGIEIVSSSKHNIEITSKGVSKGRAVEKLANYYNIKKDEIIAIGDSENDISMIEFAGMGIAMGNAIERVKQKSDFITDTNDNEGVAKAINKFILD